MTLVRWRNGLRDGVWMLLALALLSTLMTFHLGHRLPWFKDVTFTLQDAKVTQSRTEHLAIHRHIQRLSENSDPHSEPNSDHNSDHKSDRKRSPSSQNKHSDEIITRHTGTDSRLRQPGPYHDAGSDPFQSSRLNSSQKGDQARAHRTSYATFQLVHKFIQEMEARLLPPSPQAHSVLVEGPLTVVQQHFPLIESAFSKHKMASSIVTWDDVPTTVVRDREDTEDRARSEDTWSVLLCLNTTRDGDHCVVSARHANTELYQRRNVMPGLVLSPSQACGLDPNSDPKPGKWYGSDLPCFSIAPNASNNIPTVNNISNVYSNATSSPKGEPSRVAWIVGVDVDGSLANEYRHVGDGDAMDWHQEMLARWKGGFQEIVAVLLPRDLLPVDRGDPLIWQVQVLVTSTSPLRAYLHPDGISWKGPLAYLKRKPYRSMSINDLHRAISDTSGHQAAALAISSLEARLRDVLLYTEAKAQRSDCPRCFQLLDVSVVLTSSFHPYVLQVSPSTFSTGLSSLATYLVEQRVLDDLAAMMSSMETNAVEVAMAMAQLGMTSVMDGKLCTGDKSLCLNEQQLIYLIDTRREQSASRNWRRLCPSTSNRYDSPPPPTRQKGASFTSSSLHRLATDMEALLQATDTPEVTTSLFRGPGWVIDTAGQPNALNIDTAEQPIALNIETAEQPSALNIETAEQTSALNIETAKQPSALNIDNESSHDVQQVPLCSNGSSSLPFLRAIHFRPLLTLHPEFSPLTSEYRAYVPYDRLVIGIRARTKNCHATAVIDRTPITDRWTNISLGLGENRIHIIVANATAASHQSSDASVPSHQIGINAYNVWIIRIRNDQRFERFGPSGSEYKACVLIQDCDLRLSFNDPCGLYESVHFASWRHFLGRRSSLPFCTSGDIEGHWLVPCYRCHDNASCFWQNAIWQTNGCREKNLTEAEVRRCLNGKKVLFVGDSTNRGIFHYLTERVNGTLYHWDKTHDVKVYPNLNEGRTSLAFAYFPQFWLPGSKRPTLDEALRKLIERTRPLANTSQTVIVLGGVHWMERRHLEALMCTLHRQSLSGVQVLVKGLGAGFHQPVGRLRHVLLGDHEKLLSRNQALLRHALNLGLHVVDTFRMTMARFKDFLPGDCSCHFQTVSERQDPSWDTLHTTNTNTYHSDIRPHYHVEGDIGAAYSEMFINRICEGG